MQNGQLFFIIYGSRQNGHGEASFCPQCKYSWCLWRWSHSAWGSERITNHHNQISKKIELESRTCIRFESSVGDNGKARHLKVRKFAVPKDGIEGEKSTKCYNNYKLDSKLISFRGIENSFDKIIISDWLILSACSIRNPSSLQQVWISWSSREHLMQITSLLDLALLNPLISEGIDLFSRTNLSVTQWISRSVVHTILNHRVFVMIRLGTECKFVPPECSWMAESLDVGLNKRLKDRCVQGDESAIPSSTSSETDGGVKFETPWSKRIEDQISLKWVSSIWQSNDRLQSR